MVGPGWDVFLGDHLSTQQVEGAGGREETYPSRRLHFLLSKVKVRIFAPSALLGLGVYPWKYFQTILWLKCSTRIKYGLYHYSVLLLLLLRHLQVGAVAGVRSPSETGAWSAGCGLWCRRYLAWGWFSPKSCVCSWTLGGRVRAGLVRDAGLFRLKSNTGRPQR